MVLKIAPKEFWKGDYALRLIDNRNMILREVFFKITDKVDKSKIESAEKLISEQ